MKESLTFRSLLIRMSDSFIVQSLVFKLPIYRENSAVGVLRIMISANSFLLGSSTQDRRLAQLLKRLLVDLASRPEDVIVELGKQNMGLFEDLLLAIPIHTKDLRYVGQIQLICHEGVFKFSVHSKDGSLTSFCEEHEVKLAANPLPEYAERKKVSVSTGWCGGQGGWHWD